MLNIFNLKLNNIKYKKGINNLNKSSQILHFSPTIKEWNSSIYAYNKNTSNLIPVINKFILKLIKSYLYIYNSKIENKIRRQKLHLKRRRLSSHKIYVSKGEFKYTNDKVIINIYIYNRQKYNYFYKIKKIFYELKNNSYFKIRIIRIIKKGILLEKKIADNKDLILNNNWKRKYIQYNRIFWKNFLKKSLKRHMLYIYYKKLLLLNDLKFKYTYLNKITNIIKSLYNKNIEFNIINLKYFYLNSDIYTQSIINKITKKRKKLYKIFKSSVRKVKIADNKWMQDYENTNLANWVSINNFIEMNKIESYLSIWTNKTDPLNNLLNKIFSKYIIKKNKSLRKTVLNIIKNKTITGVRLEAKGRLSKRHTASRSVHRLRYKGSLKNRDSSYKRLSTITLRGNIKPNLQYTKLNSTARIGSFGIKGWISNN